VDDFGQLDIGCHRTFDRGGGPKSGERRDAALRGWHVVTKPGATGSCFEITVDGKPRGYRDTEAIAGEAARYLKLRNPNVEVVVRDIAGGETTVIKDG
jgi:hypothetical protein